MEEERVSKEGSAGKGGRETGRVNPPAGREENKLSYSRVLYVTVYSLDTCTSLS